MNKQDKAKSQAMRKSRQNARGRGWQTGKADIDTLVFIVAMVIGAASFLI